MTDKDTVLSLEQTLRLALEALKSNRSTHHYCEDTWYSCPKHEDGCANEHEGDECTCGADEANAGIDQAITAVEAALEAKDEPWEKFCDSHCVWTDHHPDCKLAQRTWVGLTDKDWNRSKHTEDFKKGVDWAEEMLKARNS